MKLDQTDATARRIGPIRCVDASGTPVVSGFGGAGVVEISINDGPYVAALGSIVVIGGGYVYYQATLPDVSTQGFVSVKLSGICEEFTLREEIERSPQGIPVNSGNPALAHTGPLRIVDSSGVALATVAGITAEISINGSAWAAPGGTLSLIEAGYADYTMSIGEIGSVGWLAVKLTGACQEFVEKVDITDGSIGLSGTPILTVLTTFSTTFRTARLTTWEATIADFPAGAQAVIMVHYADRNEMYVARDAEGAWHWPFDLEPENAVDLEADPVTLQLAPRGGWPPCDVEIQVAAAFMAEEA